MTRFIAGQDDAGQKARNVINDRGRIIDNRYRRHQRLRRKTKVLAFTIFLTLMAVGSVGLCLFALKG